jgi:hypothetical protein
MIYTDYKTCSHSEKIIYPLVVPDWAKSFFSLTLPDSYAIEYRIECALCGSEWNEYTKHWDAPLFARPLENYMGKFKSYLDELKK